MTLEQMDKADFKLSIPPVLYGTAWKENDTQKLVDLALQAGFRGFDTANQRKHYFEEGVGSGIQQFLKNSYLTRHDLFLQTKFTQAHGQDSRKPYDDSDSLKIQVKKSFESSLHHLQTDYIDSYVLHGPTFTQGITEADLEIWEAMEELQREGKAKLLGISNVTITQIRELYEQVSIKPSFLQNRCFAITRWDQEIREFCEKHNIIYQGFSLLTANQTYLSRQFIQTLAAKYNKTIPQIIFRFALQIGILPLTGTTKFQHMSDDLHIQDFNLTPTEIEHMKK